ncbi:hypothetical protein Q8F55_004730 [Vanrija albida]|uniref:VQ domain-containing protein n=1 Tax=Vanrija albida TaxID=181172 RepID=A0ABR3PZN1_9TREE
MVRPQRRWQLIQVCWRAWERETTYGYIGIVFVTTFTIVLTFCFIRVLLRRTRAFADSSLGMTSGSYTLTSFNKSPSAAETETVTLSEAQVLAAAHHRPPTVIDYSRSPSDFKRFVRDSMEEKRIGETSGSTALSY